MIGGTSISFPSLWVLTHNASVVHVYSIAVASLGRIHYIHMQGTCIFFFSADSWNLFPVYVILHPGKVSKNYQFPDDRFMCWFHVPLKSWKCSCWNDKLQDNIFSGMIYIYTCKCDTCFQRNLRSFQNCNINVECKTYISVTFLLIGLNHFYVYQVSTAFQSGRCWKALGMEHWTHKHFSSFQHLHLHLLLWLQSTDVTIVTPVAMALAIQLYYDSYPATF